MSWQHLSNSTPVARKQHQCCWCGERIVVGEKHAQWSGTMDGEFQNNRAHTECMAAIEKLRKLDPYSVEDGWTMGEQSRGEIAALAATPTAGEKGG